VFTQDRAARECGNYRVCFFWPQHHAAPHPLPSQSTYRSVPSTPFSGCTSLQPRLDVLARGHDRASACCRASGASVRGGRGGRVRIAPPRKRQVEVLLCGCEGVGDRGVWMPWFLIVRHARPANVCRGGLIVSAAREQTGLWRPHSDVRDRDVGEPESLFEILRTPVLYYTDKLGGISGRDMA
jgi:hypothetical protein